MSDEGQEDEGGVSEQSELPFIGLGYRVLQKPGVICRPEKGRYNLFGNGFTTILALCRLSEVTV